MRTAWLFGAGGKNFVDTMLTLGGQREEVSVVTDQVGCPTWTVHLAGALVALAERPDDTGIHHIAGAGSCSWNELAGEVFERAGIDCRVLPASSAEFVRPAARPAYSVLGKRAARADRARAVAPGRRRVSRDAGDGMRLLVCGGAGFIGSNFVRLRLREHGDDIIVLDKLTYAGRRENLEGLDVDFVHAGIEDADAVAEALDGVDAVVNFAAETHVDRSIAEPDAFVTTHAVGTWVLLEAARAAGVRYLQVSTDEVYGSIESGSFTESSPLQPSSPYSATKAGADLLVSSYFHTFGLETLICRGSNNYGPYQYPEKLIPLMILNALHGDRLPVYGDGMQVRNWLYVEDFGRGIGHVLEHGTPGEAYNVGGPDECPNIEVVKRIIELTGASEDLLQYVTDRPGHDRRYSLGSEKVRALGWEARTHFAEGLEQTVDWYRDNPWLVGADPLRRLPRVLRAPVRVAPGGVGRRGRLRASSLRAARRSSRPIRPGRARACRSSRRSPCPR